ncbi:MAG: GNAT family N-acetyltransferase [Planctomycetota bacterium]|nr:GNAT family N-acetyltransferase [Planctomycetota bacterium]
MKIECRTLDGFHRLPFARFTSSHTNRMCEQEPTNEMVGATVDGRPAGLVVVRIPESGDSASIESIFVDPTRRRIGVGRSLLAAAREIATRAGASKLMGEWYDDAPSASLIETLLARDGWKTPEPKSNIHRASRPGFEFLDRTSRPWRRSSRFELESWSGIQPDDLRIVDALRESHDIPLGLHPSGETVLEISADTSLLLRDRGSIAGWFLHHHLGHDIIRYSSLWVRPDLIGRGVGLALAIEGVRRHLAVVERRPRGLFKVSLKNDAMHRFITRRIAPGLDRSSTLLHSERGL